ncbi:hypothetical protein ACJRO7_024328 [Eucalyptus globulus]|uniref:Methyltransferase type 11 domain-containing protein n=1 Tax=Eucalyptus globulus TaxID=34317 RepID=A0ABD3K760_EUCGL
MRVQHYPWIVCQSLLCYVAPVRRLIWATKLISSLWPRVEPRNILKPWPQPRNFSGLLPLISYIYERGWRQGFSAVGGWPGPQKEFELIKGYLEPVLGGNIIDASCGSGPFTRLFAKSGLFSLVVALDYSENMLRECYEFIEKEENFPKEDLILVRADISRLPFVSSSVDAVHAGAAIHCWSSPSSAVAEISRVLRPGGIFVATTFIYDGPYALNPFSKLMQKNMFRLSGGQFFLSEHELEDLCKTCGLEDFKCTRNRRFVMISATKPS